MNNNNNDSLHGFPRPSFSGTIGLGNGGDNNNNNNSSSSNNDGRNNIKKHELSNDRYNVEQDSKRQRHVETNMFGYYNYDNNNNINSSNGVNYSQFYNQSNSFYTPPYMYSSMNQSYQYFPNNYGQSCYQGYSVSMNSVQQQNHMTHNQQAIFYNNNKSMVSPSNSANLISYKDIYSNEMVQQVKNTKKSKKNKLNKSKGNNNNNNNHVLLVKDTTSYSIPSQSIKKKTDVKEAESFKEENYDAKDDILQVKTKPKEDYDNSDSSNEDFNEESVINDKIGGDNGLDIYSDKTRSTTIPIPGTSITLVTDEDIAKWREERKKMWLLKISNRKEQHMEAMGIKKEDLNNMGSILRESKKERQFIQNIQNQVNRFNPKVNLNLKFVQKEMLQDNTKLLSFIKELGDSGLLEYELTEKEKKVLFGNNQDENNKQNSHKNASNKKLDKVKYKKTINNNNNSQTGSISSNNIKKNYKDYKK